MDITEIAKIIEQVESVISVNIWEKGDHQRIYIELPKLNGGKNWNGGRAGTCFYDFKTGDIVWEDWAGAKTRDRGYEIINQIKSLV